MSHTDSKKQTPLQLAKKLSKHSICKLLVQAGAKADSDSQPEDTTAPTAKKSKKASGQMTPKPTQRKEQSADRCLPSQVSDKNNRKRTF